MKIIIIPLMVIIIEIIKVMITRKLGIVKGL